MNGYSSLTEILTIRYLQRKKRPYVLYVNGGVIHEDPKWRYRLKTKLVSGANYYFAPTPYIDPYLIHYGARQEQIMHYPYATVFNKDIIKEKISLEAKANFWKNLKIKKGPVFISAGQFVERKNNIRILELWKKRPKSNQLLLIGSGPDEAKYRRFITDNELKNVYILPYQKRDRLLELMSYANGLIILSKEDIYGHVVNESLSQGVPVISSRRVMAALHLIKEGQNGFLVDLQDDDVIMQAISDLCSSDMFTACRETAINNTIEVMVAHHLEAFKRIIA